MKTEQAGQVSRKKKYAGFCSYLPGRLGPFLFRVSLASVSVVSGSNVVTRLNAKRNNTMFIIMWTFIASPVEWQKEGGGA